MSETQKYETLTKETILQPKPQESEFRKSLESLFLNEKRPELYKQLNQVLNNIITQNQENPYLQKVLEKGDLNITIVDATIPNAFVERENNNIYITTALLKLIAEKYPENFWDIVAFVVCHEIGHKIAAVRSLEITEKLVERDNQSEEDFADMTALELMYNAGFDIDKLISYEPDPENPSKQKVLGVFEKLFGIDNSNHIIIPGIYSHPHGADRDLFLAQQINSFYSRQEDQFVSNLSNEGLDRKTMEEIKMANKYDFVKDINNIELDYTKPEHCFYKAELILNDLLDNKMDKLIQKIESDFRTQDFFSEFAFLASIDPDLPKIYSIIAVDKIIKNIKFVCNFLGRKPTTEENQQIASLEEKMKKISDSFSINQMISCFKKLSLKEIYLQEKVKKENGENYRLYLPQSLDIFLKIKEEDSSIDILLLEEFNGPNLNNRYTKIAIKPKLDESLINTVEEGLNRPFFEDTFFKIISNETLEYLIQNSVKIKEYIITKYAESWQKYKTDYADKQDIYYKHIEPVLKENNNKSKIYEKIINCTDKEEFKKLFSIYLENHTFSSYFRALGDRVTNIKTKIETMFDGLSMQDIVSQLTYILENKTDTLDSDLKKEIYYFRLKLLSLIQEKHTETIENVVDYYLNLEFSKDEERQEIIELFNKNNLTTFEIPLYEQASVNSYTEYIISKIAELEEPEWSELFTKIIPYTDDIITVDSLRNFRFIKNLKYNIEINQENAKYFYELNLDGVLAYLDLNLERNYVNLLKAIIKDYRPHIIDSNLKYTFKSYESKEEGMPSDFFADSYLNLLIKAFPTINFEPKTENELISTLQSLPKYFELPLLFNFSRKNSITDNLIKNCSICLSTLKNIDFNCKNDLLETPASFKNIFIF